MGVFGSSNRGKTETLRMLINLFELSGRYKSLMGPDPHPGGQQDRIVVFERNGFRIGISTLGDTGSQVEKSTRLLIENECNVVVTATRTQKTTISAFESVAHEFGYEQVWFQKNKNMNQYCSKWPQKQAGFKNLKNNYFNQINMMDASFILNYLDSLPDAVLPADD